MQKMVNGEQPFKAIGNTFAVAACEGYTLEYSVDKEIWTAYPDDVPANENLIVNGVTPYMWFRLAGNTGEVEVIL